MEDELGSDHKPIIITYEGTGTIPKVNNTPKYKWHLKKADWAKYQQEIENNIPTNYKNRNTNKLEKNLRKLMNKAAKKHVKKKKITNKTKPWMSTEIKEAIKRRNELRKNISTKRKEWISACQEVATMIQEAKEEKWKEYVEGLDMSTNPSQVWKTIRSMDGRYPPSNKNETLTVYRIAYVVDKDKTEAFTRTYKGFSKLPSEKKTDPSDVQYANE